ncbi:MAG: hypothetical protein H6738_01795 [Alphaproteobacteria bacterium]|nr:hypothetical protein [Alphaproteobacteria bacterium]MCB9695501.1 hypothetical protein [Alphaproteobacteria bacterium]
MFRTTVPLVLAASLAACNPEDGDSGAGQMDGDDLGPLLDRLEALEAQAAVDRDTLAALGEVVADLSADLRAAEATLTDHGLVVEAHAVDLVAHDARLAALESDHVSASDLSGVATRAWVEGQGYATPASLQGYATWTGVAAMANGFATEAWVTQQGYVTSTSLDGYATEGWVDGRGFVETADLDGYATLADLEPLATEAWVTEQGFAPGLADYLTVDSANDHLYFDGANVYVRSGLGQTEGRSNGRGNLIVGYDEPSDTQGPKTGSHFLIVGAEHSYAGAGGVVFGSANTSESGGHVLGGGGNTARSSGVIVGGWNNYALGGSSVVVGGGMNVAEGLDSVILGGQHTEVDSTAGYFAVVLGGSWTVHSGTAFAIEP